MFWILVAVMLSAGILFVAIPLYRAEQRLTVISMLSIVAITAISATIYSEIGTPNASEQLGNRSSDQMPMLDDAITSLSARLQENPDDLRGWKMLGRSYIEIRNYQGAAFAFEQAVELESAQNSDTLSNLAEALFYGDQRTMLGRAGDLIEQALAISPGHPKALFFGGMVAMQRGNNELAAQRWEALLATSPPPQIEAILREQVAALRGTDMALPDTAENSVVVNVNIALGENAGAAEMPDLTVFIIARDPAQPSPPIAAVRRRLSELPLVVALSDSDAMIPGRVPSGFDRLEIIARVSLSGQPIASSGDWFGQQIIDTAATDRVQLIIDQQVP